MAKSVEMGSFEDLPKQLDRYINNAINAVNEGDAVVLEKQIYLIEKNSKNFYDDPAKSKPNYDEWSRDCYEAFFSHGINPYLDKIEKTLNTSPKRRIEKLLEIKNNAELLGMDAELISNAHDKIKTSCAVYYDGYFERELAKARTLAETSDPELDSLMSKINRSFIAAKSFGVNLDNVEDQISEIEQIVAESPDEELQKKLETIKGKPSKEDLALVQTLAVNLSEFITVDEKYPGQLIFTFSMEYDRRDKIFKPTEEQRQSKFDVRGNIAYEEEVSETGKDKILPLNFRFDDISVHVLSGALQILRNAQEAKTLKDKKDAAEEFFEWTLNPMDTFNERMERKKGYR